MCFDFHHHHKIIGYQGIYNKSLDDDFMANFFSIGLHPKDITNEWKSIIDSFYNQAESSSCLSIGECGLDSLVNIDIKKQAAVFEYQIELAETLHKPLTTHCVRQFDEIIRICKNIKVAKVIHGFNKKEIIAKELVKNGFYISFGAALLNNLSLQSTFQQVPDELIFLETDTSTVGINDIYNKAAQLKNISFETLKEIIKNNLKNIQA